MELENSMLLPTVHDASYDEPYRCDSCAHKNECDYWDGNCEDYEEE